MADLSDITAYLASAATSAVYPNGTSSPPVAANLVRIYEGWPQPDLLDLDMAGYALTNSVRTKTANGPVPHVSIYPMQGATATPHQILDQTYTITPVSLGMSLSVVGGVITLSGQPNQGEYVSIIADRQYPFSASGVNETAIINALAAYFTTVYAGVTTTVNSITIPYKYALVVRQGGVATLGKVTHRQRQSIMVSVWAPTHAIRTTLSAAIDNTIKQTIKITLPDTSDALVCYSRTNLNDQQQVATVYRRDLIYDVEYATVFQFPGYPVTISEILITAPAQALTPPTVTALT